MVTEAGERMVVRSSFDAALTRISSSDSRL